jgi:HlyD family secretion protein
MKNHSTFYNRNNTHLWCCTSEAEGANNKNRKVAFTRLLRFISLLGALILVLTACGEDAVQSVEPTAIPEDGYSLSESPTGSLRANGILHPISTHTLSFSTGGNVEVIDVEVGIPVLARQTIAVLDDTELQRVAAQAEIEVRSTQAKLAQLQAQATPVQERVIAATAAISSAQAALTQALTQSSLRVNQDILDRAALTQAERALQDAQNAYDQLRQDPIRKDWAPYSPLAKALEDAEEHYRLTLAEYRLHSADRRYEVAIANAETQLAQAHLALYEAQNPVSAETLDLAQLDVIRAEQALDAAEVNLARTELTAPFDGIISAVHVNVGEWAQTGVPVVAILDVSRWHIETRNVSELDIGQVRVGQKASARVNAFRNDLLEGYVATISPVAVVQQGDTTYTLIIELQPTTLNLHSGMTAQVEIFTE